MALSFLSNRPASELKRLRLSRRKGLGGGVKSGAGSSSRDKKSPARSSGSISGGSFVAKPSAQAPTNSNHLIFPSSPGPLERLHGRRNFSHPPSRNATSDSETTQVEVDPQTIVSVKDPGKMAGPSQRSKLQWDEVDERGSAQHAGGLRKAVEYDATTGGAVSCLPFHATMDHTRLETYPHPRRPSEDEPNFLSFKRQRTSSTMSASTIFVGDPSSSNSSLPTLDRDWNEDTRCSSPVESPSLLIEPYTPPREELALNSPHHTASALPSLLSSSGESHPPSPLLNGHAYDTLMDHIMYSVQRPGTFDDQPATQAGPSKTRGRSKSLDANFKLRTQEKEGDGMAPFRQTVTVVTAEPNCPTEALRTPSRSVVPAIVTSFDRPMVAPDHSRSASVVSVPRAYIRNMSTRHPNSKLRALCCILKGKVVPHRGSHSPVVERRPRPSLSSHGLRQHWKALPFSRLFQRVTARSVPTTRTMVTSSNGATVTSGSVRGTSGSMQVYRRNTRTWHKNQTEGPPKSSAMVFGSRDNLKKFIEYSKD